MSEYKSLARLCANSLPALTQYVDIVPRRIIKLLVIALIVVGVVLLAKLHAYYLPVPPALTRAYAEAWHRVTSSVGELLTT